MSASSRRALISVTDKQGLGPFVSGLADHGFEIVSTGGTRRFLEKQGLDVVDVADCTGFPEIFSGRVKTLHPLIHGAILARPDRPEDAAAIREFGIEPLQLVVCNLYRFEETIARTDVSIDEAVEEIDIGGPCMIRAAAKNYKYVGVVTSPAQYEAVLEALGTGNFDEAFRCRLAAAAFELTARYDRAIADWMAAWTAGGEADRIFPDALSLQFHKAIDLRYGENPHQQAAFYSDQPADSATLGGARQLHGKELSYNNLLDLDAALWLVREFDTPAAVVIKHTNPCGCGIAGNLPEAFEKAYAGDPISAFGSILGFNRPVDSATADRLCQPERFIEAVIAPGFEPGVLEILTTRPKWKKNVRLLECSAANVTSAAESTSQKSPAEGRVRQIAGLDLRRVSGGLLVQDRDLAADPRKEWKCVTDREPTETELADLAFAWSVVKHVKSNAIVFAQGGQIVGVGAGQMSRLDSVVIAARKAGSRSRAAVMASDAFFPFRDGLDEAARAGITAVIQPGGSRGDEDVIAACNEHGISMLFTGRRHFRH